MIDRYTTPIMKALWNDKRRFETWFEVELAVLAAAEKRKKVPQGTARKIKAKAKINPDRILELEADLKHDVIAFTTSIAEQVGEPGRYFHYGLTSSDVVDTALAMLLANAGAEIIAAIDPLIQTVKSKALQTRKIPAIGRTHGVHAEPMSFGLKFLGWYCELQRQKERLKTALTEIRFGKLSGAVGCYGVLGPEIEKEALEKLGLQVEPVSTQVLPRDRHARFFAALAELGGSVERISVEMRHLQRTEVGELEEEFSKGQKGSSAMPHKKNPISAENLTGCARLLRGYSIAAMENVALWHERDISHSSVERVIGPDATTLVHYMLLRLRKVVASLKVNRRGIEKNLMQLGGVYFSGHVLLAMVQKGISREEGYVIVQKAAHIAWEKGTGFLQELGKECWIQENFSRKELQQICKVQNYLKHVDEIYKRSFAVYEKKKR